VKSSLAPDRGSVPFVFFVRLFRAFLTVVYPFSFFQGKGSFLLFIVAEEDKKETSSSHFINKRGSVDPVPPLFRFTLEYFVRQISV